MAWADESYISSHQKVEKRITNYPPDSPVKRLISSCFEESFPEIFFSKLAMLFRKQTHFSLSNKNYKYSELVLIETGEQQANRAVGSAVLVQTQCKGHGNLPYLIS